MSYFRWLTINNDSLGKIWHIMFKKLQQSWFFEIWTTRKFTRRASKRRCVVFAVVWREPSVIIRHVLFAAGGVSLASSAIIYNIVKVKVTRWPIDPFDLLTRLTCWPVNLLTFSKKNPSRAIARSTYIHRRDVTRRAVWPVDLLTRWPFRKRTPQGQLRGPRTYTVEMQCSKRCRIRLCSRKAKGAFCSCVAWGWRIYNIVEGESDLLTFSRKNPSRANGRSTYVHPPSLAKIRQRTSEDIGNKQTNAAWIIVW